MPEFKWHCDKSEELFSEKGEEYHCWIDHHAVDGYRHRQVLHNKEGVEVGVQLFGEKSRNHLEQHIRDDYKKNKIPSIKELRCCQRDTDGLKEHKSKYKIRR